MTAALETSGLGKQYGRRWALHDCTLDIPEGKIVGLVGPNGAGKTTLLQLAVGLLTPLARIGFVAAQDTPAYSRLSVSKHLRMGALLNPNWDSELAARRIDTLDIDLRQPAGSLSGGQRAQLALTLAIAKRPELLLLDEPVASLDPLARREFLQALMEIVAEHGVSVVLSSISSPTWNGSATTSSSSSRPMSRWLETLAICSPRITASPALAVIRKASRQTNM